MKTQIVIDKNKLIELIKLHTVQVDFIASYKRNVCNAVKLLKEIHTCADCDKDTFIQYVNAMSSKLHIERDRFERIAEIDILFRNIQQVGAFVMQGHREAGLGDDPFIVIDENIKSVLPINF